MDAIEIYEFKLHKYPKSGVYNGINRFKSIEFKEDSCGNLSFEDKYEPINKDELYSCDSLDESPKEDDILHGPKYMNPDGSEHLITFMYNEIYKKQNPKKSIPKYDDRYSDVICQKINERSIKITIEYLKKLADYKLKFNMDQDGYIYKYNTNKKVIVFGDIHGGFHTFFRSLLRLYNMGVITNMLTLEINPEYCIVFLGDVIDRGVYGVEIYYLLMICVSLFILKMAEI